MFNAQNAWKETLRCALVFALTYVMVWSGVPTYAIAESVLDAKQTETLAGASEEEKESKQIQRANTDEDTSQSLDLDEDEKEESSGAASTAHSTEARAEETESTSEGQDITGDVHEPTHAQEKSDGEGESLDDRAEEAIELLICRTAHSQSHFWPWDAN